MKTPLRKILSHESGAFWQFVKYGVVGVMSTAVQMVVFYILAATAVKCLKADDWAVKFLSLPSVDISDALRSIYFAVDMAIGFVAANIFCWLLNRAFVFRPGRFLWYLEFAMFFGAAATAWAIATGLSALLIHFFGIMTTQATIIEIAVSFLINYFSRRFFIFKR